MRAVVLAVTAPSSQLKGYVRRFLHEWTAGVYAGSASPGLVADIATALRSDGSEAVFLAMKPHSECGFEILYFKVPGRILTDFDGLQLVEIIKR